MADILDETLEDLREEKNRKLMYKYGRPLLTVVVLIVFVTLGKVWWDGQSSDVAQQEGAQFMEVVKSMKNGGASTTGFDKLMEGKSVYSTLAGLNLALIQSYGANFDQAAKTYAMISENNKADKSFREYAGLMSITMGLAAGNLTDQDALKKLDQYVSDKNAIFKSSAIEMKAAMLLESGNIEEARTLLQGILKDEKAPMIIKGRAYEMLLIATPAKKS